ncbi:MAG TPA: hypothetical protein VK611_13355 [Acidimicrobiales bacterium]|nr:hypothetical protein [Acidimicrobiales bacterium]
MQGTSWARRAGLIAAAIAAVATAGCASESESSLVLDGSWERMDLWERRSSFDFDQVAAGNGSDTVAWLSRRQDDETGPLVYWEIRDGDDPAEFELPTLDDTLLIPVAVAADGDGWAAVAVTRDRANGANTGLLAWHGRSGLADSADVEQAQPLTPPAGVAAPPSSVSVGRSADHLVVTALYDGQPVVWSRSGASSSSSGDGDGDGAWRSGADGVDLGLDAGTGLRSLRVVGDGARLVLAGVDDDGTPHLWTSGDGSTWDALSSGSLPRSAGSVALLAPLEKGSVAVGWLGDEESAPQNATAATIQRLTATELVDEGVLEAAPDDDVERVRLTGATVGPDERLVVVGGALRPDSDRTPMAWVQDGDEWRATDQEELTGHLDWEFRAIVATDDDRMIAVAAALSHPDVESWQWRPGD